MRGRVASLAVVVAVAVPAGVVVARGHSDPPDVNRVISCLVRDRLAGADGMATPGTAMPGMAMGTSGTDMAGMNMGAMTGHGQMAMPSGGQGLVRRRATRGSEDEYGGQGLTHSTQPAKPHPCTPGR